MEMNKRIMIIIFIYFPGWPWIFYNINTEYKPVYI